MIVYGRNAVRELLRGPRTVSRLWATSRTAREEWLVGIKGCELELADGGEIEGLCGSSDHQGVCALPPPSVRRPLGPSNIWL
ncbi:MAG: hypothetical protein NTV40_08355 [Solirubrobacterales bacterium]|nr:hypothetical protein [Solirubrobacterales bacterium]